MPVMSHRTGGVEQSEARSIRRRLIVNADDFGGSEAINQAVIRAHCEGILTTASLMVNEPACGEAARLARAHPRLGVGLHLTLVSGQAALKPQEAPGLINPGRAFTHSAIRAEIGRASCRERV